MTPLIDRPIGKPVTAPPNLLPDGRVLQGRYVRLEKLDAARHGQALWEAVNGKDDGGALWTYMGYGPFADEAGFMKWLTAHAAAGGLWLYSYVPEASGKAAGVGAFMRADGPNGVIEIGHIWITTGLQRTREATESIYLMMRHAFDDLGMRRLEWKCDDLNAPSRRAAARFGFTYEGTFRQHMIYKGRNRDTAWFAIIDKDWPRIKAGFEAWLAPGNFDGQGREIAKLRVG